MHDIAGRDGAREADRTLTTLLALALVAGPALAPQPAAAQEIKPSEPVFWVLSGATLATVWQFDAALRRDDPTVRTPAPALLSGVGYRLGGADFLIPAFSSVLVLSQLTGWPTEPRRVGNVVIGAASAGVVTEAVKFVTGRGRPRTVADPRRFQPLTRDNSWMAFPSGHATAGFGVAAALAQEFDLGVMEPAVYGVAALIAWSRIYDDAHWASDTVAGAIIGIAMARTTVAWLNRSAADDPPDPRHAAGPGVQILLVQLRTR
jgi:membrane-associated phospholipid phosphatase